MISISCGIIVLNECKEILLAHASRTPHWDILKGRPDAGETPVETAIREAQEESGLVFSKSELTDLGEFQYRFDKKLHLFAVKVKKEIIDVNDLHCESMVIRDTFSFPEVDAYKWVSILDIPNYCAKNMIRCLTSLNLQDFT